MDDDISKKNARTLAIAFAVVVGMVGLSFASVPLYRVFCQVTGYGGTTQRAEKAPDQILSRTVEVRFNTQVGRHLNWSFHPDQRSVTIHLGQQGLASFSVRNNENVPVTGVALYNVMPAKVGRYFHKIRCFCFGAQTLNPGEKADYPVVFFVDPSMAKDPNMVDVSTITLSYTFFQKDSAAFNSALDKFTAGGEGGAESPENDATAGTVALPPEKQ